MAFNTRFNPGEYNDTYFLDEYKAHYGVTYIDDFQNIYDLSSQRLGKILCHIPPGRSPSTLSILDAGAAAGFFLKCARDHGIGQVTGVEISPYACRYAEEHFGINMMPGDFMNLSLEEQYDIITAWYFIEHCEDTLAIIRKVHRSLKDGGIFAFSVPSIFGPAFRFNRDEWVASHPSDHRIDVTPRGIRRILKHCGFNILKMTPGGIHPERLMSCNSLFFRPFSALYGVISRVICFSDTLEVYAVKRRISF